MASRLVLVIGDLFIPDRAPVSIRPGVLNSSFGVQKLTFDAGDSAKGLFPSRLALLMPPWLTSCDAVPQAPRPGKDWPGRMLGQHYRQGDI